MFSGVLPWREHLRRRPAAGVLPGGGGRLQWHHLSGPPSPAAGHEEGEEAVGEHEG